MPFKHFLTTSLDFERTHQLILQCLFNEPAFFKAATGQDVSKYKVKLEPVRGLFDIGIFDAKDQALCLMELKMWSGLSKGQLENQGKYLKEHQCKGLHILLGTSDLQFHRDDNEDEINEATSGLSQKIGYQELDAILKRFIESGAPDQPITIIAENYREALQKQASFLERAWLDPQAHNHFKYYSTYNKIRKHLMDERFYIYSVNNAGGAVYILNDDQSWTGFKYKGYDFQIYQEMLDLEMMIRIYSEDAPNHIRAMLKDEVIRQLQENDPHSLPWSFHSRTSKYHKIAIYKPELKSAGDLLRVAELFKALNPVIKRIANTVREDAA